MLFILLGIFIFLIIVSLFVSSIKLEETLSVVGFVGFFVTGFILIICLAFYNSTKTTVDKKIIILEEKNKTVIKQVEPIIERYLEYEKKTLSSFKVEPDNIIALSMFPELKGNEFLQSQINLVIKNQEEITKLKLEKVALNSYKLWIFMGE